MATQIPPAPRRQRKGEPDITEQAEEAFKAQGITHILVQLRNANEGSPLGPPLKIPVETDRAQLETLANRFSDDEDTVPFSFKVNLTLDDEERIVPVHTSVKKDLLVPFYQQVSSETVFVIDCEPEALFKVREISRCSSTLDGHASPILCASFSPTGSSLATGSGDNTCRLWDLHTEAARFKLVGHRGDVLCVEWDGLERQLATGSLDTTVRLWDPKTGQPIGEPLRGHQKWITSLAWEPIHVNASTPRLASSSKDGSVRVWNTKLRKLEYTLGGHTASVNVVRWGGEGVIYTASSDRTVKLWNSERGQLIRTLQEHAHWVNTLALNTDFMLRTGPFDFTNKRPKTDEEAQELALKRYKNFTKNQPEMIVSGSDDHTLFLWSPLSDIQEYKKKPVTRMTGHQKQVNHVAFSPDGKYIASAGFDNAVRLWNGQTGKFIATLRGHVAAVYRLSWSSDSRMLVSASKDSTLKLWDLRTYKIRVDLPGHTDEVYCVDFVADKVASGGRDKKLKIWRH